MEKDRLKNLSLEKAGPIIVGYVNIIRVP